MDVSSTSSLNIQAGIIHDGALLNVRSNGRLDLTVSTNVNFIWEWVSEDGGWVF